MFIAVEARIVSLAARQHRNVTRAQLLALGLSSSSIGDRLAAGRLHRVHNGVYALGTPAKTALERAAAAVLACGDGALLSHEAALALWDLRRRGWPSVMEVTVPSARRRPGIRVHTCPRLSRRDVRRVHRIAVTSPAKTLLDCAPRLSDAALARAVNDAIRAGTMRRSELAELLDRCRSYPHAHRLTRFVAGARGVTRSEFEDAFLPFCERFGLPQPLVNSRVGGYEVDAYFEEARLIVELDSWGFHNDRDAFETDRLRDANALAAGVGTLRITWERLHAEAAGEAARLAAIIAARSRAAA
jgi:predicted transcriptional regulator of viral defense system